ncbi:MAG: AAA family ATPase [Alphaproteobacteria bacterium]
MMYPVAAGFLSDLCAWAPDGTSLALVGISEGSPPRIHHAPVGDDPTLYLLPTGTWNDDDNEANIYYSAAALRAGVPSGLRGTEADIAAMLAIVVDLDDPAAAARWKERASAAGLMPTYVVESSRTPTSRVQLVFMLKEPIEDIAAWRVQARRLECWFGGDWCSKDPAHVWRLPGTMNWPSQKKRRAGRVPEMATVILRNDCRFDLGDFDELPEGTAPVGAAVDVEAAVAHAKPTAAWVHAGQIAEHLPGWLQEEIAAGGVPEDRSKFDMQVAKECVRAGIGLGDMLRLYQMASVTGEGFTAKYREREKTGRGVDYLARTYERGRAQIIAELGEAPEPRHFGGEEIERENEGPRWLPFVRSYSDFKGKPYPVQEYWLSPWIPKRSIIMVHGRTGHGKSRWLLHQTFALARGVSTPGSDIQQRGRVLYLDGEQSQYTVQATLMELGAQYGEPEAGFFAVLPSSFFVGDYPNFTKADHKREFLRVAKHLNADVLVIDNVRSLYPGMVENDANAWADVNNMLRWYRDHGFTVIIVHHDRKAVGESPDMTFSGSTNALTAVELQIHVDAFSKDERIALKNKIEAEHVDPRTGLPRWYFKNAVRVKVHKNRAGDLDTQRDVALAFLQEAEGIRVELRLLDDSAAELILAPTVLNLTTREIAYAMSKGYIEGVPALGENYAEILARLRHAGRHDAKTRQGVRNWVVRQAGAATRESDQRLRLVCSGRDTELFEGQREAA